MRNISGLLVGNSSNETWTEDSEEEADDEGVNVSLIVYLSLCFAVGFPLNVYTFLTLRKKLARSGSSRTTQLKVHLNISDILVLNFLALWRGIYEGVQYWYGGSFLCKFFKFGQALGLELSSAIIICIALDRVLFLVKPFTSYTKALRRTKSMIWVAWGYAVIFSFPQILAFRLFDVPDHRHSPQCAFWYYSKAHEEEGYHTQLDEVLFVLHNWSHIVTTFWLPIVLMTAFYSIILFHMWRRYRFPKDVTQPLNTTQSTVINQRSQSSQDIPPVREMEEEDSTTGCPDLVVSFAPPSQVTVSHRGTTDCDYDSIPELVASSFAQRDEDSYDVIQLMPCLMDFREPSTRNGATDPQPHSIPRPQKSNSQMGSTDVGSSRQSAYKKDQQTRLPAQTTKTTVLLINAYLVCWAPVNINLAWGYLDNDSWFSSYSVFRAVQLLIVLNSVLNPLIYGISLRDLWRSFTATLFFARLCAKWNQARLLAQRLLPSPFTLKREQTPQHSILKHPPSLPSTSHNNNNRSAHNKNNSNKPLSGDSIS